MKAKLDRITRNPFPNYVVRRSKEILMNPMVKERENELGNPNPFQKEKPLKCTEVERNPIELCVEMHSFQSGSKITKQSIKLYKRTKEHKENVKTR